MLDWTFLKRFFMHGVPTIAARVYFASALARYESAINLPDSPTDAKAIEIAERLKAKASAESAVISMTDAMLLERMTARLLPAVYLYGMLRQSKAHFERLSSAEEYKKYVAANPALSKETLSAEELRATIEELLGQIQDHYVFAPFRESVRSRISLRITMVLLALIVLVLIASAFSQRTPAALVVVMLTGALGGLVSVQFRIQSMPTDGDAIRGALSLHNGWFSVYFSPLVGAISAGLLYMMFQGNLISGGLFPKYSEELNGDKGFLSLVGSEPLPNWDYAKLITWSFIAGFTERLVPDTLSRLSDALASQKFPSQNANHQS